MGKQGKRTREKPSAISPEHNSNPGRVWGIQHIMKYYQRNQVKKMFMHKKHGGGRNGARLGTSESADSTGVDNLQEHDKSMTTSSNVEEQRMQSTHRDKRSAKSRFKALMTEEISRKGQHNRSSTYPSKSPIPQAEPVDHLGTSNLDPLGEMLLELERSQVLPETRRNHHATDTLDVLPQASSQEPTTNNETCAECDTLSGSDSSEYSQIHKHGKEPTENHALLQQTSSISTASDPEEMLIRAKILTADASPQLFKDFLDALEIINSNRDFLLKVLQKPSSPLVHHYHTQQTYSGKMVLNKSSTFPTPGTSSGCKGSELGQLNQMVDDKNKATLERQLPVESEMKTECVSEGSEDLQKGSMSSNSSYRFHRVQSLKQVFADRASNSSSISAQGQNQMVLKRFKDLKQKLKHVIEDSKNGRHHITMDGILHKIPHGKNVSMELKKILGKCEDTAFNEGKGSVRSGYNRLPSYSFRKRQLSPTRTPSLKESMHRYSQLYENTFNRDIKYPKSERLRLKAEDTSSALRTPKVFKRFLSMPNLKSYFHQNDEPPLASSPMISFRKFGERTTSISRNDERKSLDHSCSNKLPDNMIQESILKGAQNEFINGSVSDSELDVNNDAYAKESIKMDDFPYLTDSDTAAFSEQDAGTTRDSAAMTEDAKSVFSEYSTSNDIIFEDSSLSEEVYSELNHGLAYELGDLYDRQETKVDYLWNHFDDLTSLVEVNATNRAEFNYVREVLEISGFTEHEPLGMWYSDDQPVDPLFYEELEGCWLSDPNYSGNESGQRNHLLLFDLINEVLMEIYGRSCSYYPKPLSSVCHLRVMPLGENVLREVWTLISFYLNSKSQVYLSADYHSSKDLSKPDDGWMNLQFDSECIALELDDLIFDDLWEEIFFT